MEEIPPPGRKAKIIFGALVAAVAIATLIPHETSSGGEIVPIAKRKNMPGISMRDLNGSAWALSDHLGKPVLINLWATWCGPCREETPRLVRLADDYRSRGLAVAGISMDDTDQPVREFVRSFHVSYPVLFPEGPSPYVSAMSALPTSFLVDKQGRMAKVYVGAVSQKEVRADVDRLLAE
jgi:thiol-disulfide isomerase/thioredoxin